MSKSEVNKAKARWGTVLLEASVKEGHGGFVRPWEVMDSGVSIGRAGAP